MERFLIGMLGHTIICQSTAYDSAHHGLLIHCKFNPVVTSITFSLTFSAWQNETTSNSIHIFGASRYYRDIDGSTHIETIKPDSNDIAVASLIGGTLTITSFTTTDGKVHTADNLNY